MFDGLAAFWMACRDSGSSFVRFGQCIDLEDVTRMQFLVTGSCHGKDILLACKAELPTSIIVESDEAVLAWSGGL